MIFQPGLLLVGCVIPYIEMLTSMPRITMDPAFEKKFHK